MLETLTKYKNSNHFGFIPIGSLERACNAPTNKSGIYIVYGKINGETELIYIGSSGQKQADGTLKTRKAGLGGMKDRIVNGHQFGKIARKKSWPAQMHKENITSLEVHWWVTYDDEHKDFPREVENGLLREYFEINKKLPRWNREF